MFHALRGHILSFLFCAVLLSLSMAKAAVAIPPDVLEAARLGAIPLPEHPASGESLTLPTEKVVCFLSLFLWCAALSICCVCYAELRPVMVVLVNMRCLLCRSSLLFLLAVIMVAFNVAFLAYVVFLMVVSFWPHVLSKLVFMGSVAFRLPFSSVCRFPTRFHGGYYSSCNFLSVLLLSCFLSVHFFQVSFLVCVIFKLVSLVYVTFRLFSRSVLSCS